MEMNISRLFYGCYDVSEAAQLLEKSEKDDKSEHDVEKTVEKIPYPKSVFFIIANEFCERFNFYGMRTILSLYLVNQLKYSDDNATIIYHVWTMLAYFTPLLGAFIADSLLGRFRTILYLSMVYMAGSVTLSLAAVTPWYDNLDPMRAMSFTGLILIALGTGGIKPCVSSFGGDQFRIPEQQEQLTGFFSIFYFSINAGSLISTYLTPVFRAKVECFGDDCYALAFGVPCVLMFVSVVIFVLGGICGDYVKLKPHGTIFRDIFLCISHALKRKRQLKKTGEKRDHWLEYADDRFDSQMIKDVQALLRVLFLYLPLPVFWTLFDQQGSRWTFMATRMNGDLGSVTLLPDQMQIVNPLLILILIPIMDNFVYPAFAKANLLKKPLQRMVVGGFFTGTAFIVSAILYTQIEASDPILPTAKHIDLSFTNGAPCNMTVSSEILFQESFIMEPYTRQMFQEMKIADGERYVNDTFTFSFADDKCMNNGVSPVVEEYYLQDKMVNAIFFTFDIENGFDPVVELTKFPDEVEKADNGYPMVKFLYNMDPDDYVVNSSILIKGDDEKAYAILYEDQGYIGATNYTELEEVGKFKLYVVDPDSEDEEGNYDYYEEPFATVEMKLGGVYNILIQRPYNGEEDMIVETYEVTAPNDVNMLWMLIQYFLITLGEVMFSVTGLAFSFTQAPASMKSVLTAAWYLTIAIGNLVVVIIVEASIFDKQSKELFFFGGLMYADMILFGFMCMGYVYAEMAPQGAKDDDVAIEKRDSLALKEKITDDDEGKQNKAYESD